MPKPKAKSTQANTHNFADYVVYTISVPNIPDRKTTSTVIDVLKARQVPGSYQQVHLGADIYDSDSKSGKVVIGQKPSTVNVPRLCTFWRGQTQEDAWTDGIREALKKLDVGCVITCGPWVPQSGYPMGAMD